MMDDETLERWFCGEILPLERALTAFIRRNWKMSDEVIDLRHDIYALVIGGARNGLPNNTKHYIFTVARNHLINRAKRASIVSFDLVADLETIEYPFDMTYEERRLNARESLRCVQEGLEKLSPRVREIVRLRKIEGLNVEETAARLNIGRDAVNHQLMMGMRALADHMLGGSGRIVRHRRSDMKKGLSNEP